jgi:hypothetical protein
MADAGGTKEQTNVAIGSYVATTDQWDRRVKPLWVGALQDEGVECFHRTDMEVPGHGEFDRENWTRTDVAREHQLTGTYNLRAYTMSALWRCHINIPCKRLFQAVKLRIGNGFVAKLRIGSGFVFLWLPQRA